MVLGINDFIACFALWGVKQVNVVIRCGVHKHGKGPKKNEIAGFVVGTGGGGVGQDGPGWAKQGGISKNAWPRKLGVCGRWKAYAERVVRVVQVVRVFSHICHGECVEGVLKNEAVCFLIY